MRQPGVRDVPRQPGCLHKIRGFPSLPRDRFGLLREVIYFKRLYDDALDLSNLRAEIYPAAKGMTGPALEPDFHLVLQEFFNSGNRHLTAVKDAGRQGRFGCGFGKDLQEMVCATGPAGGDNRN